ncbi:hypothetical protein F4818DRAFT_79882 [Hypoxylon cercidicola]|nr:hypothetical protein F4818DRAFT_79882 [Hypoxylon cercidicola]
MAQQGGTYRHSANAASSVRSNSSSQPQGWDDVEKVEQNSAMQELADDTRTSPKLRNENGHNDDRNDWAVVPHPEANTGENPPSRGASSHFDITLGWGKWKFTVFSWDASVRKQAGENPQRRIQERQ